MSKIHLINNEKLICLIEIQRRKHIDVQCSFNDYTTMAMLKFSRFNLTASMSDFAAQFCNVGNGPKRYLIVLYLNPVIIQKCDKYWISS